MTTPTELAARCLAAAADILDRDPDAHPDDAYDATPDELLTAASIIAERLFDDSAPIIDAIRTSLA